jgi:hypothetical protein
MVGTDRWAVRSVDSNFRRRTLSGHA